MIKARIGNLLILGIEERNVQKLRDGQPIMLHMREVSPEGSLPVEHISIFYGETFAKLVTTLKEEGVLPPDMEVPEPKSHKEGPIQ